jgi:HK97 family phage major capsid protein
MPSVNRGVLSGLTVRAANPFEVNGVTGKSSELMSESYSLRDVILAGERIFEGNSYELQVSNRIQQLKNREGMGAINPFGINIPDKVLTRDLSVGNSSSLVQTDVGPTIFDALRPFSALVAANCTTLSDLVGNVAYPRFATASAPSGYGEAVTITHGGETFSQMTLSPKFISVRTQISTQLLKQANADAERFIRTEILRTIASVQDLYSLGLGSSLGPGPTGILQMAVNSGSNSDLSKLNFNQVTFSGSATYANLASVPGAVMAANCPNDGSYAWIIDSSTWTKWSSTSAGGSNARFLIEDNKCFGYPVIVTQNLTSHQAIFARFSDFVIGTWGVSILSNPYTLASQGVVELLIGLWTDCNVLRGPAIVTSTNAANS